jgi:DNA-directed RNA polymerase specialized sigma24 family protein
VSAQVLSMNRPTPAQRPWSSAAPIGLGAAADMVEPTWAEFADAVREQEPMVRRWLYRLGRSCDVDLVMGEVQSTAWLRLPAWRSLDPRPPLGAYVNGIARRCVQEWRRGDMTKRGGTGGPGQDIAGDIGDLPPGSGPWAGLDGRVDAEEQPDTLAELTVALRTLHALVISRPGGTAAWQRLLSDALHDVRGEQLRTEIRLFLDCHLEGRPARVGPRLQQILKGTGRSSVPTQRRVV